MKKKWHMVRTLTDEMVDWAIEALELLKKTETNYPELPDSWIQVSERLPEKGGSKSAVTTEAN